MRASFLSFLLLSCQRIRRDLSLFRPHLLHLLLWVHFATLHRPPWPLPTPWPRPTPRPNMIGWSGSYIPHTGPAVPKIFKHSTKVFRGISKAALSLPSCSGSAPSSSESAAGSYASLSSGSVSGSVSESSIRIDRAFFGSFLLCFGLQRVLDAAGVLLVCRVYSVEHSREDKRGPC